MARTSRTTGICWCRSALPARGRMPVASAVEGTLMHIGLVGLGKMGANMCSRLRNAGIEVTGYDRNPELSDVPSLRGLVEALPPGRRVVWVMVPAGAVTRAVIAQL